MLRLIIYIYMYIYIYIYFFFFFYFLSLSFSAEQQGGFLYGSLRLEEEIRIHPDCSYLRYLVRQCVESLL